MIDDILGLLILTIVTTPDQGQEVSVGRVLVTTASAFGFLLAAIVVGKLVVPIAFRLARRIELPGTPTVLALIVAFGLAWLADRCGSAMIIGAFAAGLLVVATPQSHEIERGITVTRTFLRPLVLRHGRRLGRHQLPGSVPAGEPLRPAHRGPS